MEGNLIPTSRSPVNIHDHTLQGSMGVQSGPFAVVKGGKNGTQDSSLFSITKNPRITLDRYYGECLGRGSLFPRGYGNYINPRHDIHKRNRGVTSYYCYCWRMIMLGLQSCLGDKRQKGLYRHRRVPNDSQVRTEDESRTPF